MVVSVIESTKIALLVTVRHAEPLMARMIRHYAIVRKCWIVGCWLLATGYGSCG
jgi:hypothetical protein